MSMNVTSALPPRSFFLVVLESGIGITYTILALAGNLAVCLAISRNTQLRTVPNFLLLNLAIADILSAGITFPLLVSVLIKGHWIFHPMVCLFQAFQMYASYCCSLLTLALSSVARYCATVHPVKNRTYVKVNRSSLIICVMWTASLSIASAPILGWGNYRFEPLYALCIHEQNSSTSFDMFLFSFLIINSLVMVVCYSRIFKAVKTRHRRVHLLFAPGLCSRQLDMINRQEARVTTTVFVVICLFAVCYLPTIVLGIFMFIPVKIPRFARMFSTFSVALASVVNPIVYWVRSKTFRDALKGLFVKNTSAVQQSSGKGKSARDTTDVCPVRTSTIDHVNQRGGAYLPTVVEH